MKLNRGFWSGLAAVALMGGLLAPVVVAPSAQAAAPVISSTSVITQGAVTGGISLKIAGSGFKLPAAGLALSDFTIGGTGSGLTPSAVGTPGSADLVTITFSGTAALNGTITIQAKTSAYAVAPIDPSNTLTFTVGPTVTQPTLASQSVLVAGARNPVVLEVEVTNSQVSCCGSVSLSSVTVTQQGTGLTLTNAASAGGNSTIFLTFSGTVTAPVNADDSLAVVLSGSALNPSVAGASSPLYFTVQAPPPPAPVISNSSGPITEGDVNPVIEISTTSVFAASVADDSLTINTGTTGLTRGVLTRVSDTRVSVAFTGTAASGSLAVTAAASAFNPVGSGPSNQLSFSVQGPAPVIASVSTITLGAVNPSIVVTTTGVFAANPTSFNVSSGGTALKRDSSASRGLVRNSDTQVTITLVGTAAAGTVQVTFDGPAFNPAGLSSNTLSFVVGSSPAPGPTPTPAVPPAAPTSAASVAGNGEVTVSWQAPTSHGSFPVTNYQVQSTPGSRGCVVPVTATSCRVGGLTNGTAYTFQVRALNGGGWGSWANAGTVTPGPGPDPDASIVITGSRSGSDRVARVRGETTGLVGASVQSMLRMSDRVEFAAGASRQVDDKGAFTWQRRVKSGVGIEVYFTSGPVRSNTVTIPSNR